MEDRNNFRSGGYIKSDHPIPIYLHPDECVIAATDG
jgi:hypothetical protein